MRDRFAFACALVAGALGATAVAHARQEARPATRIAVHVPNLPSSLNLALDGSAVGSALHRELHEPLVTLDPATLAYQPVLCERFWVEDTLILAPGAPAELRASLEPPAGAEGGGGPWGTVREVDGGIELSPGAPGNPLARAVFVPDGAIERIESGTVFTFRLRSGVRWHDGHPLDARDVLFSAELYANPEVRCDARRFLYEELAHAELVDPATVRFHRTRQYFQAMDAFASLCLLPSHLYDLRDPDHERHDAHADPAALAREINDNAHNVDWIGLGPYRLFAWDSQSLRARRNADYFDAARSGFVEEIAWRKLGSDDVVLPALVEGEIDFTDRIDTRAERTIAEDPALAARFRTGHFHRGRYGFIAWNMRRPLLADSRVRTALAHAFDFEGLNRIEYGGRALRVTGPQHALGPGYDRDVAALPFDLARAEELLVEAGWIDRDGDLVLDRDGAPFALSLLVPSGNPTGERVATVLQEALARIGAPLSVDVLEAAAALARVRERDFDGVLLSWTQPLESDPEPLWHSRWAASAGSNLPGLADSLVDELIERGQQELDPVARAATWRDLHRRLHDLQPYLFLFNAPVLYALRSDIEGFEPLPIAPNYDLRSFRITEGDGVRR